MHSPFSRPSPAAAAAAAAERQHQQLQQLHSMSNGQLPCPIPLSLHLPPAVAERMMLHAGMTMGGRLPPTPIYQAVKYMDSNQHPGVLSAYSYPHGQVPIRFGPHGGPVPLILEPPYLVSPERQAEHQQQQHLQPQNPAASAAAAAVLVHPYLSGNGYYTAAAAAAAADVRRKNATRESTGTLKAWLYEHRKNPYPTKGEKIMLAIITRMTLTQVSTWFANARRRLKKESRCGGGNGQGADEWVFKDTLDDEDDEDIEEDDAAKMDDIDDVISSRASNMSTSPMASLSPPNNINRANKYQYPSGHPRDSVILSGLSRIDMGNLQSNMDLERCLLETASILQSRVTSNTTVAAYSPQRNHTSQQHQHQQQQKQQQQQYQRQQKHNEQQHMQQFQSNDRRQSHENRLNPSCERTNLTPGYGKATIHSADSQSYARGSSDDNKQKLGSAFDKVSPVSQCSTALSAASNNSLASMPQAVSQSLQEESQSTVNNSQLISPPAQIRRTKIWSVDDIVAKSPKSDEELEINPYKILSNEVDLCSQDGGTLGYRTQAHNISSKLDDEAQLATKASTLNQINNIKPQEECSKWNDSCNSDDIEIIDFNRNESGESNNVEQLGNQVVYGEIINPGVVENLDRLGECERSEQQQTHQHHQQKQQQPQKQQQQKRLSSPIKQQVSSRCGSNMKQPVSEASAAAKRQLFESATMQHLNNHSLSENYKKYSLNNRSETDSESESDSDIEENFRASVISSQCR